MDAGWPFGAGDYGYSDCAQSLAQGIDGQNHYPVVAYAGQMGFPDFSSQRIHG